MSLRPDRVGQRVGGFLLQRSIAAGPTATVYRGKQGALAAAIKIYHPDPSIEARVGRERDALLRVRHCNVAALLDWGRLDDGAEYLVSEWIAGEPLEARLATGALAWRKLEPLLAALADGLSAIHDAELVHRDLKPSNVILSSPRDREAVIIDLGHALSLTESRLTTSGIVLGSASYMAPEQAAGEPLDGRADLYALGVILYRALTGVLPFDNRSPAETLRCHLECPVVPPRRRAPDRAIPRQAEDLCLWLLAKQPSQRLPSARVLTVTLRAAGTAAKEAAR